MNPTVLIVTISYRPTLFQAYDQPDVYETKDLPEADQNNEIFEEVGLWFYFSCIRYLLVVYTCSVTAHFKTEVKKTSRKICLKHELTVEYFY